MIKVLIERHIAPDLSEHYDLAAMRTLQTAMQAYGFISSEVLHNADDRQL